MKMSNKEKVLFKNIYYLAVVQFFNYILPFMVFPYLTKYLTYEDFGKVMVMLTIVLFSMITSEFGFNLTGPHFISKNIKDIDNINKFLATTLVIKVTLSIFIIILLNLFFSVSESLQFSPLEIIFLNLLIFFLAFNFSWVFQGLEKMKIIMKLNFISKVIYLLGIFIVIPYISNFIAVIIVYTISTLLLAILYYSEIKKEGMTFDFNKVKKKDLYEITIENLSFFVARLAVISYTSLNTIIVGEKVGLKMAAIYGVAEKIYQMAQNLLSPITNAFYPYMIKNKNYKLMLYFIIFGILFLSLGCFIFQYFSYYVILNLLGEKYIEVLNILPFFYFLIIIVFVSINIGYPLVGALGYSNLVNYSVYIGALSFFIMLFSYELTMERILWNLVYTESIVLILRIIIVFFVFGKFSYIGLKK